MEPLFEQKKFLFSEQNDISGGKRPRISSVTIVENDNYKRRALKDANNTSDNDIPAQVCTVNITSAKYYEVNNVTLVVHWKEFKFCEFS